MAQGGYDGGGSGGVLRSLFGPSREEVWRTLADEIGGDFVEGRWYRSAAVQARADDWIVTMDLINADKTVYTRLRAPFVNPDGIRFTVSRSSFFRELGRALTGGEDIEVGDELFDRRFIVQGSRPELVRALLANPRIRELALRQPRFHLTVRDDGGFFGEKFPEGVDEVFFQVNEAIKDVGRLRDLFDLFAEILDWLCHENRAYEDDVQRHVDTLVAPGGRVVKRQTGEDLVIWDGDPPRHRAARALGRTSDPRAADALVGVLDDDDLELRRLAIESLGEVGDPGVAPHLVPFLGHEVDVGGRTLRASADAALRSLGRQDLADALEGALGGEGANAIEALDGNLRQPVLQALVHAVWTARSSGTQSHAVEALGALGAVEALPVLRHKLRLVGRADPLRLRLLETIRALEARASLPRPAGAPEDLHVDRLPRPAEDHEADGETLPRSSEGPRSGPDVE